MSASVQSALVPNSLGRSNGTPCSVLRQMPCKSGSPHAVRGSACGVLPGVLCFAAGAWAAITTVPATIDASRTPYRNLADRIVPPHLQGNTANLHVTRSPNDFANRLE